MKTLLQLTLAACMSSTAWCGILLQYEAPGVQTTTVANTHVYDFEDLTLGIHSNISHDFGGTLGTYDPLLIVGQDAFGGSNQTQYPDANIGIGGFGSYTLTLSQAVSYFGLYWGAGDAGNVLDFYLGDTLVQSFNNASVLGSLSDDYYGNPNTGVNMGEKYAYVNFFGTDGTKFDKIVFTSADCCGFETDNHALLTGETATPEPSTFVLAGVAAAAIGLIRRRRAA